MIEELENDFPELKSMHLPEFNIFRKWNAKWRIKETFVIEYENSSYKIYNQYYYIRLLDLRDGTEESQKALAEIVKAQLSKTKFFGQKVTFGRFFQGESHMREIIRETLLHHKEFSSEENYQIILEQSDFISKCAYTYFDGIVQEAYTKVMHY